MVVVDIPTRRWLMVDTCVDECSYLSLSSQPKTAVGIHTILICNIL